MQIAHKPAEQSAGFSRFAGLPGDIDVSFEFFPPKSEKAAETLQHTVKNLSPYHPSFVSVTYGAGGTSQDRSFDAVRLLAQQGTAPVAAHLTCVGASKKEVLKAAEKFHEDGVRHIVALRGDGTEPGAPFTPHPDGFANAAELVEGLKEVAPFEISVAAYPETHPDAKDDQADLDNLKRKLDAGADRALTQFFFCADAFFRFRDRAAAAGITAPIVPGILPVSNFAQTRKFAAACGANLPDGMEPLFAGLEDQPQARQLVAATIAADLCAQLYDGGVRNLHFYTLNRSEMTMALCHLLGKRALIEKVAA